MAARVELEIPPRRDHLALVRLVVESAAHIAGTLSDRRIDDLRLAVSEGCANALDAQRETGTDEPVTVSIVLDDSAVTVTITDRAGGFEADAVAPIPAVTDPQRLRHERGLGIPLMHSLVDEVRYERTSDGTALHLVSKT